MYATGEAGARRRADAKRQQYRYLHGINDEAALAQANVGLRINNGTRLMRNAGNAVLIRPSPSGILVLIDLSRHCHGQMVFNFAWAAFYNVFAILLAARAFITIRFTPSMPDLERL